MYNTRSARLLDYHSSMLADAVRVESFRRAIEQAVKPGDVVIDLGTGSGILAHFAKRAGAAKVFAIEVSEIIKIAVELLKANGDARDVQAINSVSYFVQGLVQADVLVTETLGDFGLDEGIMGAVIDARHRLLKPSGIIVPSKVGMWCGPIESEEDHRRVDAWKSDVSGYDMSNVRPLAANLMYQARLPKERFLAPPACLGEVELKSHATAEFRGSAPFAIARDGIMHGVGGFFASELVAGVAVTNSPFAEETSWRQCFLPVDPPLPVHAGDSVSIELAVVDNGAEWRWTIVEPSSRRHEYSTARGFG
jgi:protein arginine N-methyltransferase 1